SQPIGRSIPIGRAIDNTQLYVLNNALRPVPVGAPGELFLGGVGLARGYLNRPELTRERFIENPFMNDAERARGYTHLYRTGDLVRWLDDGNLEYLGRNDFQVKIRGFRIEPGEIESALLRHENIAQCCVNFYQINQEPYLVAYYIKQQSPKDSWKKDTLEIWQEIYNENYRSSLINDFNVTEDFSGWNSSYTGKAIPLKDMKEWLKNTIERIKECNPRHVIEIGSGTGLILYKLIHDVQEYVVSDFSQEIIKRHIDISESHGTSNKIEFLMCSADEIYVNCKNRKTDTIIINSVAQYFPGIEYFMKVIHDSIELIDDCGHIFIGDVRDFRLITEFHYSILSYQNEGGEINDLKQQAIYKASTEEEFLISPDLFQFIIENNTSISGYDILPKRGNALHEMNLFRYDVILYINKKSSTRKKHISSQKDVLDEVFWEKNFSLSYILSSNANVVLIRSYPNLRVWNEWSVLNDIKRDIGDVKDIEALHDFASIHGLHLKVIMASGNSGAACYDLIFSSNKHELTSSDLFSGLVCHDINKLASSPAIKDIDIPATVLREFLLKTLPEYMIPDAFMPLEKFPLTINGKLDRRALPTPEFTDKGNYVPPRTELERRYCELWAQALGVQRIGLNDNFFFSGGNSIKAVRLCGLLKNILGLNITIFDIFSHKTVSSLAAASFSNERAVMAYDKRPVAPLSHTQERLLFTEQLGLPSNRSKVFLVVKLYDTADISSLKYAFRALTERHQILKSVYRTDDTGHSFQEVLNEPLLISEVTVDAAKLATAIRATIDRPFDLTHEMPMRVTLFDADGERYLLMLWHH
ncbi:class I SAM-dependent methyltransferase, partial [Serratia fonticola]|uniref:class I SAM-dependent methyltransferase n=1 Tax=Serratia fonticola TaxID=47917 RepID=UPI0011613DDF